MEFTTIIDARARNAAGCAVIGVYEEGDIGAAAGQIDRQLRGLIGKLRSEGDFAAKLGDVLMLPSPAGAAAARVLLVGLGTHAGFTRKQYRKALQAAVPALAKTGATDAAVYLALEEVPELDVAYRARFVAEIFCAQSYKIPDLKTGVKPKKRGLARVAVAVADARAAKAAGEGLRIGAAVGSGLALARDLANLPPNICTPAYLGTRAQQLARDFPSIKTKVMDASAIKALKMGAFLAVTQGSDQPPRLIVCEYRGAKKRGAPICLLGKGITFDSGGISLKDPGAMDEMKFDMSGAATVLGAMRAIAELKLPINLVVIVAACENMPDGGAVKPSDIVTTMSGQTVEILNTDAEGRLILCDAITYSRRFKPVAVIDVATLTGACVVALGSHFSGLMSNDEALAQQLESAGVRADDRAWRLPIGEEYVEQLKSNFADIANIGGREGGASTAASFLGKFAKDLHWAHLDVAGTAWLGGAQKGSTGRPVPLLVDFLITPCPRDMTERVDFYILKSAAARERLTFACRLAEKAYLRNLSVVIVNDTQGDARALDDLLWTFSEGSFIPHEVYAAEDSKDPAPPVQLTVEPAMPPAADLLVNLSARVPEAWERFARIAEIIDADEERLRLGRERFKYYRDLKVVLETHQHAT